MHTLFDFITHIKGVEYIVALLFIAGYIIYWEILKPRPFRSLVNTSKEDLDHIKKEGYGNTFRTVGKVAAAPFIGLVYVIALPFVFFFAMLVAILSGITRITGINATFGWRPVEAYLAGKPKGNKKEDSATEETTSGQI